MFAYYLHPWAVLRDSFRALVGYFLLRSFGFWDRSILSFLSFGSFIVFLGLFVRRPGGLTGRLSLLIIVVMLAKNFLMPHTAGFHHDIMPQGIFFPSMYFFSYYYVYVDSFFFSFVVALTAAQAVKDNKNFVIALGLLTLVAVSQVVHLKEGPQDALIFHKDNDQGRQQLIKNTLAVEKYLSQKERRPVYLSMIAPQLEKSKGIDFTTSTTSVLYLKSIEEGRAVVSFLPVIVQPIDAEDELFRSSYFFDVMEGRGLDLNALKQMVGPDRLKPKEVHYPPALTNQEIIITGAQDKLIFFIKGTAQFQLKLGEALISGQQYYGNSYQLFRYSFSLDPAQFPVKAYLTMLPVNTQNTAYLVGPFVVEDMEGPGR